MQQEAKVVAYQFREDEAFLFFWVEKNAVTGNPSKELPYRRISDGVHEDILGGISPRYASEPAKCLSTTLPGVREPDGEEWIDVAHIYIKLRGSRSNTESHQLRAGSI